MRNKYWNFNPNPKIALMLAKRQVSEFVYDAVQLEGINFTLPEIQTLLEGTTVGGHKISDQQIALNQSDAWKHLFSEIENNKFELSKSFCEKLHSIAGKGKEETLAVGSFRTGLVTIAGTDYLPPSHHLLEKNFEKLVQSKSDYEDIYDFAIHVFLDMARNQYFFDVNKRMGRFLMNGILLSKGFPAINVQSQRRLEFNEKMLRFYESGDETEMIAFVKNCMQEKTIKAFQSYS